MSYMIILTRISYEDLLAQIGPKFWCISFHQYVFIPFYRAFTRFCVVRL